MKVEIDMLLRLSRCHQTWQYNGRELYVPLAQTGW